MIELGKKQTLVVVREKDFGIYLAEKQGDEASVLLPKKQVPAGTKIGDSIEVFIYKDSEDRLIATTQMPKLQVGEVGVLKVIKTLDASTQNAVFHDGSRPGTARFLFTQFRNASWYSGECHCPLSVAFEICHAMTPG